MTDDRDRSRGPDFDGGKARGGDAGGAATPQPWEMIGAGRYMPRRIRGSFRGRELG